MADLDDPFSDLLGGSMNNAAKAKTSSAGGGAGLTQKSSAERKSVPPAPGKAIAADVFSGSTNGTAESGEEKHESPTSPTIPGVSKEELHAVVSGAVQAALDATFGKFVKSLRTVLEDLGKRVDSNSQAVTEVKATLAEVMETLDSQAQNFHSRFHTLDMAVKEVDRGVQSIRDKQELNEAQAMLAKLAHTDAPPAGKAAAAAEAAPAAAAPAPAPAAAPAAAAPAAPAAAPAAPAAAPVAAAPAPAPVAQTPAPVPHAPAPAPVPAPVTYTPVPAAPQQPQAPCAPAAPPPQPVHPSPAHEEPHAPPYAPPANQYAPAYAPQQV